MNFTENQLQIANATAKRITQRVEQILTVILLLCLVTKDYVASGQMSRHIQAITKPVVKALDVVIGFLVCYQDQ